MADQTPLFISTYSRWAFGPLWRMVNGSGAQPAAQTWTANESLFIPFSIPFPYSVARMFWLNGSTITSSNADVGIYTSAGVRIASAGTTALAGASATQYVNVTASLQPGNYFMAYACDNTTSRASGTLFSTSVGELSQTGLNALSAAMPLPATAALAGYTGIVGVLPYFGMTRTASGY